MQARGFFTVFGAAYIALTGQYRASSTRREESQVKREYSDCLSPAGPPSVLSRRMSSVDQNTWTQRATCRSRRFKATSLPLLASRQCLSDRSQGTGPGVFGASRYLPPHALPENNSASIRLSIPVCASCPMVHGHGQAGSGDQAIRRAYIVRTASQPRLPACTIPEWVGLVSVPADWAL